MRQTAARDRHPRRLGTVDAMRRACRASVRLLYLVGAVRVAVAGRSMEPALREGDRLLVSRLVLRRRLPRRGQIVFLRAGPSGAAHAHTECIKRIVGLPHERVSVIAGHVFLEGTPLSEPYLRIPAAEAEQAMLALALERTPAADFALGRDEYVVLGDNRALSTDSRLFGPVRHGDIVGVALYRYAPAERRGWLLD